MGSVVGSVTSEVPKFEILKKADGYEIRKYPPAVATETSDAKSDDNAFRTLAGYIGVMGAPTNEKTEKISMTAPVVSRTDEKIRKMRFILPAKYTIETAPEPKDPKVQLVQIPERILAVHTFSGVANEKVTMEKLGHLFSLLNKDKIKYDKDKWELYRYNPPWTLPMARTNEVAVPVSGFDGAEKQNNPAA
eukprot:CAMPEP_0114506270 /NCGR_PEP_ID=MMETSP0109-20121206/11336_1 /TAXON_ID=29199 /ORGANISM="Chlorarachnion reptans, Strain CCCM449" /LENGTH=190 /DNA_ID=CAMNT_0001684843 /DNA_START=97 /DNA_END=669 /DNA_ORIENTATION=+